MPPSSWVSPDLRRRWGHHWPGVDVARLAADVDARIAQAGIDGLTSLPGGHVAAVLATDDLVLKVNPRGHSGEAQLAREADALEHWRPTGIVPALRERRDGGLTLVMERMRPGTTLDDSGLPFEERLRVIGGLAARLHTAGPPPAGFVGVRDYGDHWGELPEGGEEVLLHADLHGGNVLRHGDAWMVIDPHAVAGDRNAEIWALLDPLVPPVDDPATADRWLRIYCDAAGLDVARARAWARVRAVGEAVAVADEDPAWAERLARMASALG